LRFLIQEYNGGMASNIALKLQRNWSGGGGWVDVTTSSSVVKAVAHPYIADGSDCTQQIGAGSFLSNNDGFSEDGTCGGSVLDFAGNDETEVEFMVEIIGSDVTTGQTIDFRVVQTDDTIMDNYNHTPTVTIIDPVYTTLGSSDRSTTISAVSGSDPYTVTITDGSIAKAGDALWDEHAVPRKYRITAISGNDLTVVDSEAVGSAPDNSGTSTPYVKRYYSTLSSWEGDLDDTDLYQAGDDAIAEMYADADYNMGTLTVSGGGTVKLNSATVRAASGEGHTGTPGTGVTIKGASVTGSVFNVTHGNVFTRVDHIEIDFNGDSGDTGGNTGIVFNNSTLIGAARRNMVHYSARRLSNGIKETVGYVDILNNMVFNFVYAGTSAAITVGGIYASSVRTVNVMNNTVHQIQYSNGAIAGDIYGIGFPDDAAKDIRNNISTDTSTAGGGTAQDYQQASPGSATVDYNIASDTSASGANSHDSESSASLFVSNSAPYNLHLASGATNAIDGGVDLVTTPDGVELDIDLRDRDSEADDWDIGCDEYVAVVSATIEWYRPASEPVRLSPPIEPGWFVAITEPTLYVEPPGLSWWEPASQPVFALPPIPEAGGLYVAEPNEWAIQVTIDWYQQASEPVFALPPVDVGGEVAPLEPTLYAEPPALSWFQPVSQPVLPLEPSPEAGGLYTAEPSEWPVTITLDQWYRPASEPILPAAPVETGWCVSILEPTLYTAPPELSWFQPISRPVLALPSPVEAGGIYVAEPSEWAVVTVIDWYRPIAQPIVPLLPVESGWQVEPVEPTLYVQPPILSWQQPTSQPVLPLAPSPEAGGIYICDPSDWPAVTVTLDQWYRPTGQPVLPLLPVDPGWWTTSSEPSLYTDPPELSWYRPASEPTLPLPPAPEAGGLYIVDPTDWPAISSDVRTARGADAIRVKLNGVEIQHLTAVGALSGVYVQAIAARHGPGIGRLRNDGAGKLSWQAPDSSTFGPAIPAGSDGAYLLEDGDDRNKWIRLQVHESHLNTRPAEEQVYLDELYANGPPHDDVSETEALLGHVETYQLDLMNESPFNVGDLRVWLDASTPSLEISDDGSSWVAPTDETGGLQFGELVAGYQARLYLRRTISAGAGSDPDILSKIHYAFSGI
jgi:hypothetical protein